MEEGISVFKILLHRPTGNRLLGRLRRKWDDNVRMNITKIGLNTSWIDSCQGMDYCIALVNTVLNLWAPKPLSYVLKINTS